MLRCNFSPLSVLYTTPDKTQLAKQKTKFTSKRGDKRNLRLPVKTKNDSFSVKAGLASFSSATGGNNFFGMTSQNDKILSLDVLYAFFNGVYSSIILNSSLK